MSFSDFLMTQSFELNNRASVLADESARRAEELRVTVHTMSCGARVLDAGVKSRGGLAAGLMLARLCIGGLGDISLVELALGDQSYTGVQIWTDHPAIACLACQYAGWAINPAGFFAMGSGPIRAKARVERELFEKLGYAEDAARAVLVLEGRTLPDDTVAEWVAAKAGVVPSAITFAIAPTASLAGGVQIVARVIETGLHKMEKIGFDVTRVISAVGTAPLATVAQTDMHAIGRTNDCILYGGRVRYVISADDDQLEDLAQRLPASTSPDYGTPFYEIFKRYNKDFYRIDPLLFSPAEVWLTSLTSGRTFHAGAVAPDVLRASLL
jgi:methenyltetrahydromethanopterin cyclohydrolase